MEHICALALLLVSLCSARSPPFPHVIPLDCNATEVQAELAVDFINKDRDEGFVLRPVRVKSVFQQQSVKLRGGFIYYMNLDVVETECSVLSGKTWKECNHEIPMHQLVFGHCRAIIFIARPWRIMKLLNYNCTLSSVPSSAIHRICPDCPTLIPNITPDIKAKADRLVQEFNRGSNETRILKVDNIEKVRSQRVFGPSYFLYFTVKETDCLKAQAHDLANCNFLKDLEANVGFCQGSSYTTLEKSAKFDVSCEIYNPRDHDDHHHHHRHEHCGHGQESSKSQQGKESPDAKGPGEAGPSNAEPGADTPGNCRQHKHGHCPPHRDNKHPRCHPGHHHHPHHDHHHHHHQNHTHPHDTSHHHHVNHTHPHDPSHHHHRHHHHNHTSSETLGSSSEENSDKKPSEKRSKGSVQMYYITGDSKVVPTPTIIRPPPPPGPPGKYKPDYIAFPNEDSTLKTCPGEPVVDLPQIVKKYIFA